MATEQTHGTSGRRRKAERLYLLLAGLFIASLISCNLIFQKFFFWRPLEFLETWGIQGSATAYRFEISVGILPYPITFLITDLISEIFGRKRAQRVVITGLWAAVFVLFVVSLADWAPATEWSPVSDETFSNVFGLTVVAVGASMAAYLLAQLVDVRLFHFWKQVTAGKHLWVRNNFSTIVSQLVDTATVLGLLCAAGAIEWYLFPRLLWMGFLFKVLVALFDTPVFYLATYFARRHFGLKPGEEVVF